MARAISHLATPIDPRASLAAFLEEVRGAFSSTCVELVLFDGPELLRVGPCPAGDEPSVELAALLVARGGIQRGSASGADAELAAALVSAGRHDVLAAPLVRDGRAVGALVSYDRTHRKSGVSGKSVSVRVDLGGGRVI